MRIRLRRLAGDALPWPGPDAEWTGPDGGPVTLRAGWQIVRWDTGQVTIQAPAAAAALTEPEGT